MQVTSTTNTAIPCSSARIHVDTHGKSVQRIAAGCRCCRRGMLERVGEFVGVVMGRQLRNVREFGETLETLLEEDSDDEEYEDDEDDEAEDEDGDDEDEDDDGDYEEDEYDRRCDEDEDQVEWEEDPKKRKHAGRLI